MRKPLVLKTLSWIILVPSGAALVLFSVVNRHAVTVDFWPLDIALELRLFVVILGVLMFGVLWGGLAAWLAGGGARRRAREAQRRADTTQSDLRQARQKIERLENDLKVDRTVNASTVDAKALPPADAA